MKFLWDCEEVIRCDAFLYDIEMQGKKDWPNLYVGYGEGTPDGTYNSSIVKMEALFYADCLKYNPVMRIRETGKVSEMKKREKEDMDANVVNTNEQYYNSSRSNGFKMDIDLTTVLNKAELKEYEITSEPWDVIIGMEAGQKARSIDYDMGHVTWIKDQMNDTMGKWLNDNNEPVLTLRDYFGKGKHWRIGKRHTVLGISKTKFKPNLDVVWIPKSDYSKLKSYDIRELALLDNPVQKNKRLDNDLDAVADTLAEFCADTSKDQTDPIVREKLERMNYGDTEIRGLKVRIKNKLANSTKGLASNEIFVPTSDTDGTTIAEAYRDKDTHSISISSGYVGKADDKILSELASDVVLKKTTWVISVYHPELKHWNAWDKKKTELRKKLNNLEAWLKVTRGKGADEEILQEITFTIREKNPIELRVDSE
jgi:hypothetical protein